MRKTVTILALLCCAVWMQANTGAPWIVERNNIVEKYEAGCPSFPSVLYASLVYNVGCIPWNLEFSSNTMSGDANGAYFQWYRYKESEGASTAQPCSWQTDHSTFEGFKPATDEMNSRYIYYCKVTTPNCPNGVNSGNFTVVVGQNGDPCPTFAGTTFTITSGGSYTSGQTVTITATTTAYGGDHVYIWYHNGEAIDTTDTHYTFVWGFNQPQLIITNIQPEDGGMYSVQLQDGTECYMYTDPVRILVDSPTCGPVPTLGVQKNAICEGESTQTGVSNNTLAAGEVGQIVYMVKPDGSNPSTTVGTWTTDLPGLYQFKYVIDNPNNPSCYRESKVVSIRVYENSGSLTITPDATVIKYGNKVNFTCTPAPGADETATVTFTSDGGQSGSVYPNTYPNFAHTCYNSGTYTYTYTITNTKAGCSRTATCEVMWYSCGWVTARFNNWVADRIKLGASINLNPAVPTETGMIGVLTVSKDGGTPEVIPTSSPYTPTDPGTYVFHYEVKHSDPRVTDCYSEVSKTIVVEPCGTAAQLSTNKTVLKLGESATLTFNSPASGETAKLEVSKDGGTAQTITGNQSPMTYTPTAVGEYVITYSITASGCGANTKSVTINVYDCGPEIALFVDHTSIQPGGTINFTLSAPGTDETATLTYSIDGGASQPLTVNSQQPVSFTPTAEGTYVFTYKISHAYIDCSRNAQVTVRAYNCGTPAGLATDKNVLKLGESATLTLNRQPVAADGETASLTVSKDGGAAQPISNIQSPMTYTPTTVGEYVLTYSIDNTTLGCATSAQVTIRVYDCGPDASITSDKNILKLGESASLTLSALGADETATLTVSKDGGAPSPISNIQYPMTYTPTEVGEYVLSYTVSHTIIDCETSASVTIRVYDCGPDAAITLSATEQKIMRPTTITLSALGADETGTLTVSKDGGTPSPVTGNPSPITFTPTELGTYTFTYTITHPYINCTRTVTATLNVIEAELVFDDKNGTHLWSDPLNWWPAYNRVPTAADSAIIRKNCNVDIDNAVTYDLTFDGGSIDIRPQQALVILHDVQLTANSQVRPAIANNFTIASDAAGNGALILGPDNTNLQANILFYARSTNMDDLYPVWQYMGSPVQESLNIDQSYPGAVFYEWTNTPNHKTGGNWQRVDSLNGALAPFTGYCMTQRIDKQYTLQGTLNNPVLREVAIPFNDQGSYSGFAFVANSWVAPISIAAMTTEDFGAADATVYIMNSGTYEEAIQQQRSTSYDGTGAARGQYNAIPVHAASYLPNALTVIPPMQGFFVHTSRATTLSLDYAKTVYTPALTRVITTPTRAPQQISNLQSPISNVLRLKVEGYGSEDEVYILTSDQFTTRFDNGWEAIKARSENSDISMAVTSADGNLAVAAIPELEGTEITFDGGNHKTYTITISNIQSPISNDLYLLDTESGTYTELRDGMTYSFKCGAATRRFVITKQGDLENVQYPIPAFKYIENGILYIRAGERLYNGTGELLR